MQVQRDTFRSPSSCSGRRSPGFAKALTPRSTADKAKYGLSLRSALGLPRCPGATKGSATPRIGSVNSEELPHFATVSVVDAAVTAADEASLDVFHAADGYTLAQQGHHDIADMQFRMKPLKRVDGWMSNLSRLSVEVSTTAQEWSAYLGGRCTRTDSLLAAYGEEVPPKNPSHTAQAASLLLRTVRYLPAGLPLKTILEPITQELLEAVYREWPALLHSLEDLDESEICPEKLSLLSPFYSLVGGYKALAERSALDAGEASKVMECSLQELQEVKIQNEELKGQIAQLEADLTETKSEIKKAQAIADDATEAYQRFMEQTRIALNDYADMQYREQTIKSDFRSLLKESREKDVVIRDFREQCRVLTRQQQEAEDQLNAALISIAEKNQALAEYPTIRKKLEAFEAEEAIHGVSFARRVAVEVFDLTLEGFCMVPHQFISSRESAEAKKQRTKWTLDAMITRLRAFNAELDSAKEQVKRLKMEIRETRQLVPVWNGDAMEDLEDAFDPDSMVHHQIYSMMDQRHFTGLGMGPGIPPYLRAEGFVQHIFVSKGELEEFMNGFLSTVKLEDNSDLHEELFQYMQRKLTDPSQLTEFAYAFICGLEAYRDDPDFELFDLMLCSAVHLSISKDQHEMLRELNVLLRSCHAGHVEDTAAQLDRKSVDPERTTLRSSEIGLNAHREQASKRVLRAALQAIFPEKSISRHNALARAAHMTYQMLCDTGKSPSQEKAYVADIFDVNSERTQSLLIEEIRRQQVHEVIEFTADITRRFKRTFGDRKLSVSQAEAVKAVLKECDPNLCPTKQLKMVSLVFPDELPLHEATVDQALKRLRSGMLLRKEKAWVRATPKDVVNKLLEVGYGTQGGTQPSSEDGLAPSQRRIRAAKVLDNPLDKMELYSSAEALENEISRSVPRIRFRSEEKEEISHMKTHAAETTVRE